MYLLLLLCPIDSLAGGLIMDRTSTHHLIGKTKGSAISWVTSLPKYTIGLDHRCWVEVIASRLEAIAGGNKEKRKRTHIRFGLRPVPSGRVCDPHGVDGFIDVGP